MITAVLVLAHAVAAAGWLGGMLYSLLVVQPKARRFFGTDDEAYEEFLATMASGNRWKVLGLVGVLAATGAVLLVVAPPEARAQLPAHVGEAVLLAAALAVFVHVSWRLWPRRVFALPEERPAVRARFQRATYALVALVGGAFLLGVVAPLLG